MDQIKAGYDQLSEDKEKAEQERLAAEAAAAQMEPTPEAAAPEEVQAPEMNGVSKWIEENVAIPLIDMVDSNRNAEEVATDRADIRQEAAQKNAEISEETNFFSETARAIGGGLTGAVEGLGETAELIGDTAKTVVGMADETDNVFSDSYEAADWDLGVTENKTAVGKFAREAISMLTVMAIPMGWAGLGAKATMKGRMAVAAVKGAIGDIVVSQDDENLSNLFQDMGLDNPISAVLAVQDEDGPWSARVKNVVEGGVFGVAVDGVGEFIGAIAKGRAAAKAGVSKEAAVEATIKELQSIASLNKSAAEITDDLNKLKAKVAEEGPDVGVQGELPLPNRDGIDGLLDLEGAGYRPGKAKREADQIVNGSSPEKPPLSEPSDKAIRSTEFPVNEAVVSQAKAGNLPNTSAAPILDDVSFKAINEKKTQPNSITEPTVDHLSKGRRAQWDTEEATAALETTIRKYASQIDAKVLQKQLGETWDETTAKALNAVNEFIGGAELSPKDAIKALDAVTFLDEAGNAVPTRAGVVAVKAIMQDTAYQLNDLATNMVDGAVHSADTFRQTEMLGDRLKALMRMKKVGDYHYGGGLQAHRGGLFNKMDSSSGSKGSMEKAIQANDEYVDNLVNLARKGDPIATEEFKNLSNGLALSGGDASKVLSFWELARKVGSREAMKSMYNSMLSSPLTHVRNLIGNTMAVTLRPIELAMGRGLAGDWAGAKAAMGAFHSFGDSLSEAFEMAGASWKAGIPVGNSAKYVDQTHEAAKELDILRQSARTKGEKAGVFYLTKLHDLVNNPWTSYPTRALTAGDDMFKTLVTRMDMKRQVFEESIDATSGGVKFDKERYAQLIQQKIGINGEIIDKQLSEVATEVTFQQELKGTMKKFDELTKSNPALTYVMPFVRTPHNLLVYAGTHTPGINRFLDEYKDVMAGSDETAKAIMRGREALGFMAVSTAAGLVVSGTMTGNGPVDRDKLAAWEKTHQKQSIKVGDKWISYASVEPLNTIFAFVADAVELMKAGDASAYDKSMGQLAYAIANATYNKSYFQGLQTAVNTFNPSNIAKEGWLEREAYKALNSFVPLSSARRQLGKALAPGIYEARGEMDRALNAAIPGYAAGMGINRVDIFTGEDMTSTNTNPLNWMLPFSIKDVETDPVLVGISEYGIDVKATLESASGIKLEADEKRAIDKLTSEMGLHADLKALFNKAWFKESYKNWTTKKGETTAQVENTDWYGAATQIIQDARRRAVEAFRDQNEDFALRYYNARVDRRNAGYGDFGLSDSVKELTNFR